jgi:histidine phosphotransferase ChpT
MTDQDITALVSSRICHDLISPIGAISNGVELLHELPGGASPELALIAESAETAARKLRCFRLAFGAAEPGAQVARSEIETTLTAMFTGRASVELMAGGAADLPRLLAKALLLTLLCQERCLPMGGESRVLLEGDGFLIETAAARIRDLGPLWSLLDRPGTRVELAPAEVQFALLAELLGQSRARLSRNISEGRITLALRGLPV